LEKKTRHLSHRKRHLAATAKPAVREQLERLRTDWPELSHMQRGDRLIQLQVEGCTVRGLADDLGVDDGTVRRDMKVARLPESYRKPIDAGASPKAYLMATRAKSLTLDMEMRLLREQKDGSPSDELRDNLLWFLLTEQPVPFSAGCVNRLISEVLGDLPGKAFRGYCMHPVKVSRPLAPSYPLGSAIKNAKPDPDADMEPMEVAIQWLIKLIMLVEPLTLVRDVAIEKLQASLLSLPLDSAGMQQLAKEHNPSSLAAVLRDWPT
jgi:hypothetical protein